MLGTSFSHNSFERINVLTRFYAASHNSVDDNLTDDCNENDWLIDANEPQALDYQAFLVST